MRYNGLNNMFFSLCQINDNHSFTSSSHTKKTKSYNYSKHHKNTLIDNKALSLFKMDDHEKVIGLIQKMKEFMIVYHQEKSRRKRTGKYINIL